MFKLFSSRANQRAIEGRVIAKAQSLAGYSDQEIQDLARTVKEKAGSSPRELRRPPNVVDILSIGVEAIKRVFGFYLHPVQIRATIAAARGQTIEMQTGEGKTVVSALIGYYYTHWGHVHLATTNQYLAERDYECIRPVYSVLGLSSGMISQGQAPTKKRESYLADVTFGPGYQFGFDYLLDQTTLRSRDCDKLGMSTVLHLDDQGLEEHLLQHGGFHTMIIDEADSVMIDEALTPLVLSGASSKPHDIRPYEYANQVINKLVDGVDYIVEPTRKSVGLTENGVNSIHEPNTQLSKFDLVRPWSTYVENALRAKYFFDLNVQYVVQEEKVKIVDQFTGRIFDDRQWQSGLHQAVCAKEKLTIELPTEVQACVSRQNYFQLYDRLIGLSGTLISVRDELRQAYGTDVALIPTHKPSLRKCLPTRFFASTEARLDAIADEVLARHKNGQPVLLGTRTISQSQFCADKLIARGLTPTVLNGIQNEEEAAIVAEAGVSGNVTIATNMAGRGTDIKLDSAAKANGGLHVIGFEHNFSGRVDRQLVGRSARQGQPGSSQFYQSVDDELFLACQPKVSRLKRLADRNGEIKSNRVTPLILQTQNQQEKKAAQSRQALMDSDGWMNQVRETLVKETSI